MTIAELREPKLREIAQIIKDRKAREADTFLHEMFLFDLVYHEPNKAELAALEGGPVPEFLKPGVGGWDASPYYYTLLEEQEHDRIDSVPEGQEEQPR